MTFKSSARAAACVTLLCTTTPAFACSSCGCNLTSDWLSQGLVAQPGTTLSLRYDYVPQDQLRAGHQEVDRSTISVPVDREIEQRTRNHYATLALDHAFNSEWAVNVQVPFVSHPHSTISEGESDISRSRTSGLADIRATVRFQGFGGPGITGVQFGVKLPTGGFRQRFRSGPEAGNAVDRGLQPGTGTVDAIIGAYHFGKLAGAFDFVLQAQAQAALSSRDGYRPGSAATLSAGVQYTGWKGITPQAQINMRVAAKDRGANADRPNSGGEQIYFAPGVTAELGARLSAFGIVQVPLTQRVNGYQLAPQVTFSLGLQLKL
jgi:hypothetical protein